MENNTTSTEESQVIKDAGRNYSFDLRSTIKDVLRKWNIILIVGVVCAAAGFVYGTETYQPLYTSSTTFLVKNSNDTVNIYANLEASMNLASSLKIVFDTTQLQTRVAEEMGYKTFPGTLSSGIVDQTNIMSLSVTSDSPMKAYEALNKVLDTYPVFTKNYISRVVIKPLNIAQVPTMPINTSSANTLAMEGFGVGAVAMILLYAVKSFFKDTIKKETDIEKKLNIKKLVSIPRQKKKFTFKEKLKGTKKSLSLMNPVIGFAFREAFKKLRRLIVSDARNNNRKIYSVTSSLENEGKTTIAVNLALDLGKMDYKVLLIDADLRKPAVPKFLQKPIPKGETVIDFLMGHCRLSDAYHYDEILKVTIMGCGKGTPRANELITGEKMKYLLDTARKDFDYVVMDTPPLGFVADAEDIIKISDAVMLVVRRDIATAITINDSIDLMLDTGMPVLGCVYNDAETVALTGGTQYGKYTYGYGGYGKYGSYGKYGKYGGYGKYGAYGGYGKYGAYGGYGKYGSYGGYGKYSDD